MVRSSCFMLATIAFCLVPSMPAEAEVVTLYTSQSAFDAASIHSTTTVIDFEGIVTDDSATASAASMTIGNVIFSSTGLLYVSGANYGDAFYSPFESAVLNTLSNSPIVSTLPFDVNGFTAVGGNFDNQGNPDTTQTLSLTLASGKVDSVDVTTGTLQSGGRLAFFGFTVTGDTIVSITSTQLDSGDLSNPDFTGLDNFQYGFALTTVPEPSSLVLLVFSSALGYCWSRRRKLVAA